VKAARYGNSTTLAFTQFSQDVIFFIVLLFQKIITPLLYFGKGLRLQK
jgi:hypothetical protein